MARRRDVGPFAEEASVRVHLHDVVMPKAGQNFGGHHHEIYRVIPGGCRRFGSAGREEGGDQRCE